MAQMLPRRRGRPPGSGKKKAAAPTYEQGYVYIFPNQSVQWENKDTTIVTMMKLRNNAEATSLALKLINLVLPPKPPVIKVTDKDGNKDEDLALRLTKMCETKEVALYKQMHRALDCFCFDAYVINYVIDQADDGFWELKMIRDLPAASFRAVPWKNISVIYAPQDVLGLLLPGIVFRVEDMSIHYYQTNYLGQPFELGSVTHFRPPSHDYDVVGLPLFFNLVPWFQRSEFAWTAQMQSVNRVGAPSIFIQVENPRPGDIELAKSIVSNWSKNNNFVIPSNFKVVEVGATVNDMAINTIIRINNFFSSYFSPADFIATDGALLGGSDEAKAELLDSFISGMQGHIVEQFTPLLQKVLEYNGYLDYSISIEFPPRKFKNGVLDQLRAQGAAEIEVIDINEYRMLLGLPPKTPEELEEMRAEWEWLKQSSTELPKDDSTQKPQDPTEYTRQKSMTPDEVTNEEQHYKTQ